MEQLLTAIENHKGTSALLALFIIIILWEILQMIRGKRGDDDWPPPMNMDGTDYKGTIDGL